MPPSHFEAAFASSNVPEPIWEMIASHMPLKDWAMASGISRTTFGVQLRVANITSSTPSAGITAALINNWHQALLPSLALCAIIVIVAAQVINFKVKVYTQVCGGPAGE